MYDIPPAVPFLNSDLIAHLMGLSNKAPVIVDGKLVTTLIDSGAQVSSESSGFCGQMVLRVHPLNRLLELEGTGGSAIPHTRYVEIYLQIPV